ncbi:zinc-dependent peptidase [Saccharicrinis sp. FJH2]|uniref:M90 family metallopeptidase n=1 Tax=Saccharicrinis sp. FJH65 TaxID=3344659 RepID=UPI0035F2BA38
MQEVITILSVISVLAGIFITFRYIAKPYKSPPVNNIKSLPDEFKKILSSRVRYYRNLSDDNKKEFENRLLKFLTEKKITGIDTDVSEEDTLLIASSAIIPMFAFPYYNYPEVHEILLYPNSFDKKFQTNNEVEGRNVLGMVGNGFLSGYVLLSRPDLEAAFDGTRHKQNVGIHEFIHLIDMADGVTDGVPKILFDNSFAFSWLREIKKEINTIKNGHSDINPYALKNNAEFLAVVAEYFFDDPNKMKMRHPELYNYLVKIFRQNPVI